MNIVIRNPYPGQYHAYDADRRGGRITLVGLGNTEEEARADLLLQLEAGADQVIALTYSSIQEARRRLGLGQPDVADSILAHAQGRIVEAGFLQPPGETS